MSKKTKPQNQRQNNVDSYLQKLYDTNPLREPVIRKAIETLQLSMGSRGLDVGCGIGYQARMLAEAVGPTGHVTGLDQKTDFIAYARELAANASLSERLSFQEGDMHHLPFDDHMFDWIWSSDCAGYGTKQSVRLVQELTRVVRPGGIIALLIYTSQQLLPGYPLLEARLNATTAGIAPFTTDMKPEEHWLRALGWFRNTGMKQTACETMIRGIYAPLSDELRIALTSFLDMRWESAESDVDAAVWKEYQRLCHPESPDFILNLPDYYAFFTYSLFYGKVGG